MTLIRTMIVCAACFTGSTSAVLACGGGGSCKCGESCDCGDSCDCKKDCDCPKE